MLTLQGVKAIYSILLATKQVGETTLNGTLVFLEDINDFLNIPEDSWERPGKEEIRVLIEYFPMRFHFTKELFMMIAELMNLELTVQPCFHPNQCSEFFNSEYRLADVKVDFTSSNDRLAVLPFTYSEYVIFYKAGEFKLSPTYFIDGLSTDLWIFIWSFFFLFFLGLLISVKIYGKHFSHRRVSVGDVAMYEMNFVANQNHRLSTKDHEKFLSWRIQMICQSIFKIIIACAFSTFILALLSIKITEKKFNSIEDFENKSTHQICSPSVSGAIDSFFDSVNGTFIAKPQFEKLPFNGIDCVELITKQTDKSICDAEKPVLLVISPDEFKEMPYETCPIIQIKDTFPKYHGSIDIHKDFKHREKLNRLFIKIRSSAIVQKLDRKYRKTLKKDYGTRREYKVYSEGVQFAHVRYIIYGYSSAVLIAFFIVFCEIIHYHVKDALKKRQLEKFLKYSTKLEAHVLEEMKET